MRPEVNLRVVPPEMDKNYSIQFEAPDLYSSYIYNVATKKVMDDFELQPFHQGGELVDHWYTYGEGWHMWEIWKQVKPWFMDVAKVMIEKEVDRIIESGMYKPEHFEE